MALSVIILLLALIGGRVIPSFTLDFLSERGLPKQPPSFSRFDGASILLAAMAAIAWTVQPETRATGWLLVVAGLVNLVRLLRWYGWMAWREPLVLILHVGYGWLAMSLLILGGAILGFGFAPGGCGARTHDRCCGLDDPGDHDPRQPRPYGAPTACGAYDGHDLYSGEPGCDTAGLRTGH